MWEEEVNGGDDDIGEVSWTWADETEGTGPGDDTLGDMAVEYSDCPIIEFDIVNPSVAAYVDKNHRFN